MKSRSKGRRWSGEVTRRSNALDLEAKVFKQRNPRRIAFAEAFSGSEQETQGRAVSVRDVDAQFLHQPRGGESFQDTEERFASSQR